MEGNERLSESDNEVPKYRNSLADCIINRKKRLKAGTFTILPKTGETRDWAE
jgi:hypothetical protein